MHSHPHYAVHPCRARARALHPPLFLSRKGAGRADAHTHTSTHRQGAHTHEAVVLYALHLFCPRPRAR